MNKHFLALATENFYASADSMRNFFMLGMDEKAYDFDNLEEKNTAISTYGTEANTIYITGMMLREKSWITDCGYATSTEQVIEAIDETLAEGKKVKLIINSGGGLVSGTSNLADKIFENREHIEAYATGMVASAAMWVYSAAGTRYAESTTVLGSIGVVTSIFDDEKYWATYGIIWKEIVSENAKNKRPDVKTEEGQNEVKRYLTSLEAVFINSVSEYLGLSREDVISKFHEGGLITGTDALGLSIIESLTSYNNSVATMPTGNSADKIESKIEDNSMKVTQENLDAVQAQLDEANASVAALSAEKDEVNGTIAGLNEKVATVTASLDDANVKIAAIDGIIGMAFEHNVDKATAIAMVQAGTQEAAALVVLNAKKSTGATSVGVDLGNGADVQDDTEAKDEAEEAMAYAKSLSVNKK